jgi:acetyl-CoA carboxylase carboxyltransferase component
LCFEISFIGVNFCRYLKRLNQYNLNMVQDSNKRTKPKKKSTKKTNSPSKMNVILDKTTLEKLNEFKQKSLEATLGGGEKRIQDQHNKGKYTARERIQLFLDPETFVETGQFVTHQNHNFGMEKNKFLGDGVITGYGRVNDRLVYVYAQDFTVMGGSLGNAHAMKIAHIMDQALKNGAPIVGFNDSGGARIQEGVASLAGYGEIFFKNVEASGVIPQISVIMGPSAGGAVYSPALTDFIVMTKETSHMFVTGPSVVKTVTGEEITFEDLGGVTIHAYKSGVAHFDGMDEKDSIRLVQQLLSYLPSNNLDDPPRVEPTDDKARLSDVLNTIIPDDPKLPYDMHKVIDEIVDHGEFLEIQGKWARNIIIGFARLNGYPVGIIANQPSVLAGALDSEASIKGARFIRLCDAYNIPIISLVDVPGFLPGKDEEWRGIIRNGAKLLYAYCEATVPKIAVVTRKAFGGAYIVMASKHLRTDVNLAWPTSEIAVMGSEAAVNIIFRKELSESEDPAVRQKEIEKDYKDQFYNPYQAASLGYIDEIIMPSETRPKLIEALWPLLTKRESRMRRKHGNIPL